MPAEINGFPGYPDGYKVTIIPGLHEIPSTYANEMVTVVTTQAGEINVIPSRFVHYLEV